MNQENDICDELKNAQLTQFDVLRNAIYHSHCRRIMEFRSRLLALLVVVLGASSVGEIIPKTSIVDQAWVGLVISILATIHLVFDFGRRSGDHQFFQKSYYLLLSEMEAQTSPSASDFARWRSQMITITSSEPPVLRAIDAKAHNETVSILGMPKTDGLIIPWHHWFLGGMWSFSGYLYKNIEE